MVDKSRDAFRTISEVADWLDVPTHVLRFWESRFSQIKPVKRAGGRRYYRPSDMRVIGGVKTLLHDQGMTIRGVQKLFREEGIKHVSGFAPELYDGDTPQQAPKPAPKPEETTLEQSAEPAPAARATRDATPDPIEDEVDPLEDEVVETPPPAPQEGAAKDAPVMFRRSTPAQAEAAAAEEPSTAEPSVSEAPKPANTIPPTPSVPDVDPADDAASHAKAAGVAARLKAADPEKLMARTADLAEAARKLQAVLDRAS